MLRIVVSAGVGLLGPVWVFGQGVSVAPPAVEIRAVEGWTVAPPASVAITAPGNWTARVMEETAWLRISAASGTGSKQLTLTLVDWAALRLSAGRYTARLAVTGEGASTAAAVTVTLNLAAAAPRPSYSYLSGPKQCVKPSGYDDEATCTVPDEKPPGVFTPPRRGGSYVDPNFGALVRIATDPPSMHSYSSPSALSAGNKYLLSGLDGNWKVSDPLTGRVIREGLPVSEGSAWDAQDSEVIYTLRGPRIERYDLRTNRATTVVDYSSANPPFAAISNGGAGDTSRDNWLSFYAPAEKQVCAVDLRAARTYCASFQGVGRVEIDPTNRGTLIAKGPDRASGKRYVLLIAYPAMGVFSVNTAAGKLDFEYLGPEVVDAGGNGDGVCDRGEKCFVGEHADTFEDSDGTQYLLGDLEISQPCSASMVTMRLNAGANLLVQAELGGGLRRVAPLQNCGGVDPWVDWHGSCAKLAAYCAVSTTYERFGEARDPNDRTPFKRTAHQSEVFVIRGNGVEVRRLAQHRSPRFRNEAAGGYWSTPRASISYDGAYVVFDSNFGEPNRQRVAIVETGYGPTRIAQIVDAAGGRAKLAPGTLATVFGTNLANCNQAAGVPFPPEVCGAAVKVEGVSSPILYASTGQINFQVPALTAAGAEVAVAVSRGTDAQSQDSARVEIVREAPEIFQYALEDDVARAVVQNFDIPTGTVTLNGPPGAGAGIAPQKLGQIGIVYATNLGATNPGVADGAPAPVSPLSRAAANVEVFVNGVPQPVHFAGLTPGYVGLYQINYELAMTTVLPGDGNRIWLAADGFESTRLNISLAQ